MQRNRILNAGLLAIAMMATPAFQQATAQEIAPSSIPPVTLHFVPKGGTPRHGALYNTHTLGTCVQMANYFNKHPQLVTALSPTQGLEAATCIENQPGGNKIHVLELGTDVQWKLPTPKPVFTPIK